MGEKTVGANAPRLVPVLQTLGDAERQLGNLPEALHRFERAGEIIAVSKTNMERPWLVDYYGDLGALHLSGEGLGVLQLMKTEELSDFGVRGAVATNESGVDSTHQELEFRESLLECGGCYAQGSGRHRPPVHARVTRLPARAAGGQRCSRAISCAGHRSDAEQRRSARCRRCGNPIGLRDRYGRRTHRRWPGSRGIECLGAASRSG